MSGTAFAVISYLAAAFYRLASESAWEAAKDYFLDRSVLLKLRNTPACSTLNSGDNMWSYILGPFISIFPKRWRELLPFSANVQWGPATVISGLAESLVALIGLSYWYSHAMTTWVGRGVETALSGKVGPGVTPQEIGSVALVVWASHPLTWLLGYAGVEGTIRSCAAAFTDNTLGTLPLFLLDKAVFGAFLRRAPEGMRTTDGSSNNLSSFVGAIRARMLVAKLPLVSDELCFRRSPSQEILEIHACRRKEDWTPPRVVRYQDSYYRLEADSLGAAPRPFRYVLRRLPAGVPGRTVLLYSPRDPIIREQR